MHVKHEVYTLIEKQNGQGELGKRKVIKSVEQLNMKRYNL